MKNEKYTHTIVKDEQGQDFICPLETDKNTTLDLDVCFEKDVPERYAGLINVRVS